jgi:NifU-like protein involved in Fe-S cluster formation
VRFMLRLLGERVLEARYRAYGCPYTLAACEWLARQLEAGARDRLGGPAAWAARLRIPPAKLGRLLVVEDALRAALAAADKTVTDSE